MQRTIVANFGTRSNKHLGIIFDRIANAEFRIIVQLQFAQNNIIDRENGPRPTFGRNGDLDEGVALVLTPEELK